METKAIDGVSISQLQNKFMTGDELIPVEYDGKNYNINTRDIFNNVSDYNVSVLFPNDGINGDNKYDIEPLLGKMTDNLIVAATKEYPDLFGGVTIGNGKIKIGVPGIDKDIVLEAADIDHFKSCLK